MIGALARAVLFIATATSFSLQAGELNVYAAASLSDVLTEAAKSYKGPEKMLFNFAASSLLERQISEGAPADIFFSADEAKMDALEKKGLLEPGTRKTLLSNTLVIVLPSDSPAKLITPRDLLRFKSIALAEPRTVPAGIYARIFLEQEGLWKSVQQRVVPAENVRAALAAVQSGDVEVGIVYRTDMAAARNVKVALEIPPERGPKISYPAAVLKESRNNKAAREFLVFLQSEQARNVFEKHRFIVLH